MARAKAIVADSVGRSDKFVTLSTNAQALYLQLGFAADSWGIVNNAMTACRSIGAGDDALDELLNAGFVLRVADVLVIAHWWVNNKVDKRNQAACLHADIVENYLRFPSERTRVYELAEEGKRQVNPIPVCYQSASRLQPDFSQSATSLLPDHNKEKEKEKENRWAVGNAAATSRAPTRCPHCGGKLFKNHQTGNYDCGTCCESFPLSKLTEWRGQSRQEAVYGKAGAAT